MARSALCVIAVIAVALLFKEPGSVVDVLTVAVFEADAPMKPAGTVIVVVMVADAPAAIVPSAHGYVVVHAPVLLTNASPAGVASATLTLPASDGPLLVTVTV